MTGPIFDTHAHYSARAFEADRFALLDSLPEKGVVGVCEQATHSGDAPRVLELAHRYPWVYAAIGIHPGEPAGPRGLRRGRPCPHGLGLWRRLAAEMKALAPATTTRKWSLWASAGWTTTGLCRKTHSWRCLRRRSALRLSWTSPSSSTTETPTPTSTPC